MHHRSLETISDADEYLTDEVLEARLNKIGKIKSKYIIIVMGGGIFLFVLAFLFKATGIPDILFSVYAYIWFASLVGLFVYIPPWVPPRCSRCGKRTRKWRKHIGGGRNRIYFVCTQCKLKADTDIIAGD